MNDGSFRQALEVARKDQAEASRAQANVSIEVLAQASALLAIAEGLGALHDLLAPAITEPAPTHTGGPLVSSVRVRA